MQQVGAAAGAEGQAADHHQHVARSGKAVAAESCSLAQHQRLVGMNIGEVYLPRQLPVREISPGQLVTMEYQPRRLNIYMDPKGWITKVTCG